MGTHPDPKTAARRASGRQPAGVHLGGSFHAAIKGAYTRGLTGSAGFTAVAPADGAGITLHLRDANGTFGIDLVHLGDRVAPGYASIGDLHHDALETGEWAALLSVHEGPQLRDTLFGLSGDLRLHTLPGGHLGGQFAFKAVSEGEQGTRLVTIAGEFCARPAEEPVPLAAGPVTWEWNFGDLGLDLDDLFSRSPLLPDH